MSGDLFETVIREITSSQYSSAPPHFVSLTRSSFVLILE